MDPSTDGPLPKIAADGRQPWKIYARPFDQRDDRPRISVLVTGLGLSGAATQAAITKLPAAVSLAFDPYGRDIDGWVPKARAAGHEVFLGLPMEPFDYPRSDPGPLGLLKSLRAEENIGRLYKVMGKAAGYVGLVTTMGSEFANSDANVRPVVEVLLRRGVMVVDGRSTPETRIAPTAATIGAPHASVDLKVDRIPSRRAIDGKLKEVEAEARRRSVVLVTASPLPVTIERLAAWSETLEAKSLVLAPVSAVANKQMSP